MLKNTHSEEAPWHVIDSNNKKKARAEILELLVAHFENGVSLESQEPSPEILEALHVEQHQL